MENETEYANKLKRPSMHGSNSSNFQYKMENIFGCHVHVQPKVDTLCESELVNLLMMLDGYVFHKVESLFEDRWSAAYIKFWTRQQAETAVNQIRGYNLVANLVLDKLMSYYRLESQKRIERQLSNCCTTIIVGESGIYRRNARLSHAILLRDFSSFGDPLKIQTLKYDHAEISFSTFAEALAAYIGNNRWEQINQFCPPSLYYWVKIEIKEKETSLFHHHMNFNSPHSDESASECDSTEEAVEISTINKQGNITPANLISCVNVQQQNNGEILSDLIQRETFLPDIVHGIQTDPKINIQNQLTNCGYSTKTEYKQPTEYWHSCYNLDSYMPATDSSGFPQIQNFNPSNVPVILHDQTQINQEIQREEYYRHPFNNLYYTKQNFLPDEINDLGKRKNYCEQMGSTNLNFYDQVSHLTESNTSFLHANISQPTHYENPIDLSSYYEQTHSRMDECYVASGYQNKKLRAKKSLSRLNSVDKKRKE